MWRATASGTTRRDPRRLRPLGYEEADPTLALGRELMGSEDTTVFASSDHGLAPQWYAVTLARC